MMSIRLWLSQLFLRIVYRRFLHPDKPIYRYVERYLPPLDGMVVDLGGGPGHLYRGLIDRGAKYVVVVDIDYGMFDPSKYDFDKVVADAGQKIFRDASVDYVVIHDALHHFPNPDETIRNYRRSIKRCIIIIDIDRASLSGRLAQVIERILGFPSRFYTMGECISILEEYSYNIRRNLALDGSGEYMVEACID